MSAERSQHTPGPWTITDRLGLYKPLNRAFIRESANGDHGTVIAEIFPHKPGRADRAAVNPDEREANARLIAAGPELLEAAKEAMNFITVGCKMHSYVVTQLGAAIAKAEGRK